jgi:L-rhamnose mutarotase
MPRHVLLCDLVDEAAAIAEYESLHAPGAARPEITASIRDAGVENMEIYRLGTRCRAFFFVLFCVFFFFCGFLLGVAFVLFFAHFWLF